MGFFSNIGDFISQNVQSAVHDGAHLEYQIVSNPMVQSALATGGVALGIPPQATTAVLGGLSGVYGQLGGITQINGVAPDVSTPVGVQSYTPTAIDETGAELYLDLTDCLYHYVNDHTKIYVAPNTATSKTGVMSKFVDSVKKNWLIWLIPFIGIPLGLWLYFKPKKRNTKYRK